jgi:hypothetical protein
MTGSMPELATEINGTFAETLGTLEKLFTILIEGNTVQPGGSVGFAEGTQFIFSLGKHHGYAKVVDSDVEPGAFFSITQSL